MWLQCSEEFVRSLPVTYITCYVCKMCFGWHWSFRCYFTIDLTFSNTAVYIISHNFREIFHPHVNNTETFDMNVTGHRPECSSSVSSVYSSKDLLRFRRTYKIMYFLFLTLIYTFYVNNLPRILCQLLLDFVFSRTPTTVSNFKDIR